ncbi:hypothetical protein ACVWWJ_002709 [Luteibacter sp. HA06]
MSYAAQSGIANVTGQRSQFSWAGLVASAAASGITASTGLNGTNAQGLGLSTGDVGRDVAGSLLSGTIQRETSLALGDDRVSGWGDVASTAIGTAIGSAAVQAAMEREATPALTKSSGSPLDDWRQESGGLSAYSSISPFTDVADPTDVLEAYNRQGLAGAVLRDPSILSADDGMASVAYGARADWIASADTSAYSGVGNPDLAAAEDVPGVKDPSSQANPLRSSDQGPTLRWRTQSNGELPVSFTVLRAPYDMEKDYPGTFDDLPPIDTTDLPRVDNLDLSTIPTLDAVQVFASVPRDDGSVGGVVDRIAQTYRASRQAVDDELAAADRAISGAESSVDSFRNDVRDWSREHGNAYVASVGKSLSDQIGFVEGVGLTAAHAVTGTAGLAVAASDLANPVAWALDPQRNVDHLVTAYSTADAVDSVINITRWATNPQQSLATMKAIVNGVTKEYQKDLANGDKAKFAGRLTGAIFSAVGPLAFGELGEAARLRTRWRERRPLAS